jgi:hypothetical protein
LNKTLNALYLISTLLFLSLPLHAQDSLRIRFQLFLGNEPIEWGKKYITWNADTFAINSCKAYFSKFTFTYQNNKIVQIPNSYYLVDFSEPNTTEISLPISTNKTIKAVSFTIGIDSATNTAGLLSGALSPMLGMYWSWQSGYINWKIEGTSPSAKTRKNAFQFHIGGYLPPNLAVRTVTFEPQKGINNHVVRVQLDELFNQISLKESNTIMIPGKPAMVLANLFKTCFHYQP